MLVKEKTATNYLLDKESLFWTPGYLDLSGWVEHIPFAFWIIETLKPKMVVELGVHNGVSYFSFCQAIKRLNIDAACYGIDTWKGDEHAGFYEAEVFGKVINHNTKEYSRFSTLIRSTFDEGKDYFIDGSIDLLHIDGLHTYEAVKHDFENWLPKLSTDALVVFHDINVRERNFGVFKLWEELKQQYRNFQFDFGHGLGILSLGNMENDELNILFVNDNPKLYHLFLRNIFSDRGNFFKTQFENTLQIKKDQEQTEALNAVHSNLTENYNLLATDANQAKENYKSLELSHSQLQAAYAELTLANKQLAESYKIMEANHEKVKDSSKILQLNNKEYEKVLVDLTSKLKRAEEINKNKEEEKATQNNIAEELNALIKKQQQIIGWYRDTYENRSLLGTIKEKIKSSLKKK